MGKQRMNPHKPQLRPWLIEQINSGRYQGLRWINEQRNAFRIPWKHASRHDLSEDDYRIFKDWAIASGRFSGVDASDPPRWKTNFRCALNSNESFRKLADHSKESSDPHKVYCIVDHHPGVALDGGARAVDGDEELESILYFSPETELSQPSFTPLTAPYPQEPVEDVMPHFGLMSLSDSPGDQLAPSPGHLPNLYTQPGKVPSSGCLPLGTAPQETPGQLPAQAVPGDQRWEPMLAPVRGGVPNLGQEGPLQLPAPVQLQPPGPGVLPGPGGQLSALVSSDLDITIYYRGKQVLQTTVTNTNGCRLYFQQEDERFVHLQHIQFPGTDGISDHKQKDFTDRLLANMEGGLLLWHTAGDLLAQRLGKCQVFWARAETGPNEESQKLHRNEMTKIFCLKDFILDMIQFTEQRGRAPPCATFLCFGQQFLVSDQAKKLILVKVVPKACEVLTEIAHQGGASSLDSEDISLQISSSASLDSLLALLREMEDMEVDL
ncbi:interferon regulatory factor 7 isoform X2 [Pristis pectinata]|uniref:interferon regulatory factor 7 isoform X2 n=1 Tax=Pristis pectinata TaxID=685728 RepID=UPI00223DEBAF|nr:interferon regulatory factor 7 isoform X2 [Pristis pectinata]